MTPFATDQWVMLVLVFLLGLLIGGWLFSGRKWKDRYHEERLRREEVERRHTHGEAMDIAARARADDRVTDPDTTTTAKT